MRFLRPAKVESGALLRLNENLQGHETLRLQNPSRTQCMAHRIFAMSVGSVYPAYIAKAERKGRTRDEVDTIFRWLTGHTQASLEQAFAAGTSFEDFFATAPQLNPARKLITGVVCGIRVEEIEDPTMQEIRYLDKLIDELAKGKAMAKILRSTPAAT
jgi:hypothetical protein